MDHSAKAAVEAGRDRSSAPLRTLLLAEVRRLDEIAMDMEYHGGTPGHLAIRDAFRRSAEVLRKEADRLELCPACEGDRAGMIAATGAPCDSCDGYGRPKR